MRNQARAHLFVTSLYSHEPPAVQGEKWKFSDHFRKIGAGWRNAGPFARFDGGRPSRRRLGVKEKNGTDQGSRVRWAGMVLQGVIISVEELRQLTISGCLRDVQRIQFFLLLLFTEGAGEHMVDFVTHPVRPNTLILVQPGQVQGFQLNPSLGGQLIVIDPSFLRPGRRTLPAHRSARGGRRAPCSRTNSPEGSSPPPPISWQTARPSQDTPRAACCSSISSTLFCCACACTRTAIPRRLPRAKSTASSPGSRSLWRRSIPPIDPFPITRKRLGCSQKTLTQACLSVEARTAKGILNERTLLEAKRLLAHGGDGVAQVAQQLGFSETTNFIRFFKKYEQVTPARFRDRHTRPLRAPPHQAISPCPSGVSPAATQ